MRTVVRSIQNNAIKNAVYGLLMSMVFMVVYLLTSAAHVGLRIKRALEVQSEIQSAVSSLVVYSAIFILFSILALPFLQYLSSISRGYEIGVMRALGLSKGRAMLQLMSETVLLIGAALVVSLGMGALLDKRAVFFMLDINSEKVRLLRDSLCNFDCLTGMSGTAVLITVGLALIMAITASVFCNGLIAGNEPLKLLKDYR
ncbi:MAG: FtsX-like permease family protein [Firmicutes bacterium]|nr:FtsX-like permease family protein [Bacillota bacterium]